MIKILWSKKGRFVHQPSALLWRGINYLTACRLFLRDKDGDNKPERDVIYQYDFSLKNKVADYDQQTCTGKKNLQVSKGKEKFIDRQNSQNNFSGEYTVNGEVRETEDNAGTKGHYVDFNGTISLTTYCLEGRFSITTKSPLFFEDKEKIICPTEGVVELDGDYSGYLIFNPNGSMDIDDGKDGKIDQHYNSCQEVGAGGLGC